MNEQPPTRPPSPPWLRPPSSTDAPPSWPPPQPPPQPQPQGIGPLAAPPGPTRTAGRRIRKATAVAALVAISLGAGLAGGRLGRSDPTPTAAVAATRASMRLDSTDLNVASVLAATRTSVVSIETTVSQSGPWSSGGRGAGTGIVLDKAGHILTNAHVVEGATSVTVTLAGDKSARAATIVASDASADVAVLEVANTAGLVPATFDRSGSAVVGDDVVAIGNALALQGGLTVTQGIVSATNRSIETQNSSLTGLIQTDAAISSGNSGGALVNAKGQVIGMNTAVATSSSSVSATNIGFAISTDTALKVAARLLARS